MPLDDTPPIDQPLNQAGGARFVLVEPSHRGNVGAAARAMKVMGFDDLVLVAPRFADALTHDETMAMASGATDVLARARVVARLADALDGINYACATAMTPRDFGPPTLAPRACFEALAPEGRQVAFVFGSERFGMRNDDVYQCHACVSIPTHPAYGSLNLAQAVQLVAYEWRMALGGYDVVPRTAPTAWADGVAVEGLLVHWAQALQHLGFYDPTAPKRLLPRLRQWALRQSMTEEEVHILRGVARSILKR